MFVDMLLKMNDLEPQQMEMITIDLKDKQTHHDCHDG